MTWSTSALGNVALFEREGVDPACLSEETQYVGLENISSDGSVSPSIIRARELSSTKFRFNSGHVLFGKLRPYLRKTARPDFAGVCSTDIVPILPSKYVDRSFLYHYLRTDEVVSRATSMSSGANLPRISPKLLEGFNIPLPPMEEQRRIATILDQAERLLRQRRSSIAQAEQVSAATFELMFGDSIANLKAVHHQRTLGEMAEVVSGVTKGRRLNGQPTQLVPYLAVANVQDGHLKLSNLKTIEATAAEIERYRLLAGDLLLTEGGDPDKLGRGALWSGEVPDAIHQNHIFRVRVRDHATLDPAFLSATISSPRGKGYFLQAAKQTTGIASINAGQLKNFPLFVPPLDRQNKFTKVVCQIDLLRERLVQHSVWLDKLFSSLQHRAFIGEL